MTTTLQHLLMELEQNPLQPAHNIGARLAKALVREAKHRAASTQQRTANGKVIFGV